MASSTVMIRIVQLILLAQAVAVREKNRAQPVTNAALESVSEARANSRMLN